MSYFVKSIMTQNLKSFKMETLIENEVITLITRNQMIGLFMGVKNPEMINLSTETIPKMKKGGNPYFEQIVKKSKCNYLLCTNYSKRVNVNRGKEGKETDFVPQSPKGKVHVSSCVLTNEEGTKYYLMVERFDEIKPKVEYSFQNDSIDKVMFENFLPKTYESNTQELDREVKPLTYLFDSIVGFSFRGKKFKVIE